MKATKPKIRGRFYVMNDMDGWAVVDDATGALVSFESKSRALHEATFCRAYVKKWGDISLYVYPYSLDDPLTERAKILNANGGIDPL